MNTQSEWNLNFSITDEGQVIKWAHTIQMDLGPWHAPKPCDHILKWCIDHMGAHNRTWRSYRAEYGATLIIQFTDQSDATQFALTWGCL